MFQGDTALALDAKGRFAIPARFRDALVPDGAPLVLTAHPHKCLLVYPQRAWAPIEERISQLPSLEQRSATFKRLMLGHAQEETPDTAGRILISPSLRKWAGLDKQIRLIGQGAHFELWSEAGWEAEEAKMLALAEEGLPAGFENLVL